MNSLADQPAFPEGERYQTRDLAGNTNDCSKAPLRRGMTIRQFAAIEAMKGLLSNSTLVSVLAENASIVAPNPIAKAALYNADALLAELAKPSTP